MILIWFHMILMIYMQKWYQAIWPKENQLKWVTQQSVVDLSSWSSAWEEQLPLHHWRDKRWFRKTTARGQLQNKKKKHSESPKSETVNVMLPRHPNKEPSTRMDENDVYFHTAISGDQEIPWIITSNYSPPYVKGCRIPYNFIINQQGLVEDCCILDHSGGKIPFSNQYGIRDFLLDFFQ